jgi:hypothetical protein
VRKFFLIDSESLGSKETLQNRGRGPSGVLSQRKVYPTKVVPPMLDWLEALQNKEVWLVEKLAGLRRS